MSYKKFFCYQKYINIMYKIELLGVLFNFLFKIGFEWFSFGELESRFIIWGFLEGYQFYRVLYREKYLELIKMC